MKKLLLTLLTLITVGTLARAAEKSIELTPTTFSLTTSYKVYNYDDSKNTGFSFAVNAYLNSKCFQMNVGKGCFFEVTGNKNNYKITNIVVNLNAVPSVGTATVYKNNTICYTLPETDNTSSNIDSTSINGTNVGIINSSSTKENNTFAINNNYFGIFYDCTADKGTRTVVISSITVYYDDEVGGGEGGGDTPDTPTAPKAPELTVEGATAAGEGAYSFTETATVSIANTDEKYSYYYTTDGTEPTADATEYTEAITVSETTTFKFIAYDAANSLTSPVTAITLTKTKVGDIKVVGFNAYNNTYDGKATEANVYEIKGKTDDTTDGLVNNPAVANGICTISFDKNTGSSSPGTHATNNYNEVRIYGKNSFTITPAKGVTITKLEIKVSKNQTITAPTVGTYSFVEDEGSTTTGIATWTGSATSSLTFTNSASAQFNFKYVDVYYTVTGGGSEDPDDPQLFVDVLKVANFAALVKANAASYTDCEYTSPNTDVKYVATIARDASNNFQINKSTSSSKRGIIVADNKNGYVLKKITVNYSSGTTSSSIYGNNNVYESVAAFDSSKGTEIASGTSTFSYELKSNGEEYPAFGYTSTDKAIYISSIEVEWMKPTERAEAPELVADCDLKAEDFEDKVNPFEDEAIVMVDEKDGAVYHYTVSTTGTAIRPSATVDDTTMVYDTDNGITVTESAIVTVAQVVDGIVGNTASVTLTKVDFEVPVAELVIESDGKDWGNVFKNEINVMISAENVGKHPTEIYYTTGTSNPFDAEGNLRDIAVKYESDDLLTFTANTQLNVMTTRNGKVSKAQHENFKKFAPAVPYINILEANGQSIPAIGEVNVEISVAEEANPYIIYSIGSTPILNEAGDDFGENDDSEIADECPAKIILDTDDYTNEIEIHAVAIYEFVSASGETEDIYSQEVVYKGHLFAVGAEGDDSVIRYTPVTDHSALNTEHGYMVVARANEQETYVMMMHDDATNSLIHGTHAHLHDGGIHLPANSTDHNHAEFYLGGNATDGYYLWRRLKGETEISYLHNPNTDANGLRIAETDVENALFDIVYQLPAAPSTDPEAVALASADLNEGEMYIQFRNSGTTAMFNTTANTFNSYTPSSSLKNSNYVPLQLYASESGLTTGVEGVTVEDGAADDSEAVYYNLQGVRVSAPAAGQVYIVRRGASVAKQLVH